MIVINIQVAIKMHLYTIEEKEPILKDTLDPFLESKACIENSSKNLHNNAKNVE